MQQPLAGKAKANPKKEEKMTLCIAAECWLGEAPCIVSCCDTRAERGGVFQELVGSEDVDKVRDIGLMTGLLSGDPTAADRLVTMCDETIRKFSTSPADDDSDLVITEYLKGLEKIAELRKGEIVDHHLGMTIRMPYSEFVKQHRTDFIESHSREIWNEIKLIDLGTDVILGGFSGDEPVLVRLDRYGKAHWEDNYSVVGIGADIALAFLCQRDWYMENDDRLQLIDCLYRVFEAKAAAQKNRHVGESTAFEVLMPGAKRYDITDECFKDFKRRYTRRLKPPTFPSPMTNFLKEVKDDDDKPATKLEDGTEIIPVEPSTSLRGKSFLRRRMHDEMPLELKPQEEPNNN